MLNGEPKFRPVIPASEELQEKMRRLTERPRETPAVVRPGSWEDIEGEAGKGQVPSSHEHLLKRPSFKSEREKWPIEFVSGK
jgi:hypothetical protein